MTKATYSLSRLFFFNDTATTEIYTLSLHDALPISHALDWHHYEPCDEARAQRTDREGLGPITTAARSANQGPQHDAPHTTPECQGDHRGYIERRDLRHVPRCPRRNATRVQQPQQALVKDQCGREAGDECLQMGHVRLSSHHEKVACPRSPVHTHPLHLGTTSVCPLKLADLLIIEWDRRTAMPLFTHEVEPSRRLMTA